MHCESYKEQVRWFWDEVFNKGNLAPVDEMVGDNYTYNGGAQTPEQIKQWVTFLRSKLQDLHFSIDDLLGEGQKVAIRWTLVGTDPTSKQQMTNTGTNIITFVGDKAVSNWQNGGTPADEQPAPPAKAAGTS